MNKEITAMILVAMIVGGTALGADNVADWVSGRNPTCVWKNINGSRTYRYDSFGTTTYRHRTAETIQTENEAIAAVVCYVVIGAYEVGCTIDEWQRSPEVRQQAAQLCGEVETQITALVNKSSEVVQKIDEWQQKPEVRRQLVSFCNQMQRDVTAFFTGK